MREPRRLLQFLQYNRKQVVSVLSFLFHEADPCARGAQSYTNIANPYPLSVLGSALLLNHHRQNHVYQFDPDERRNHPANTVDQEITREESIR